MSFHLSKQKGFEIVRSFCDFIISQKESQILLVCTIDILPNQKPLSTIEQIERFFIELVDYFASESS